MNVRMLQSWPYQHGEDLGARRMAPAGWTGDLPDSVASAAVAAGAAVRMPAAMATEPLPSVEKARVDLEALSRADLQAEAERRGVDVSAARTKSDMVDALLAAVE